MQVTVTFRHLEASNSLKQHVEDKMKRLKKYFIKPIEVHVILSTEKFRQQCEVVLVARDFRATSVEISDDMYHSIDTAFHKIDRQAKKHKEIIKEHKGHVPVHETAALAEEEFLRENG